MRLIFVFSLVLVGGVSCDRVRPGSGDAGDSAALFGDEDLRTDEFVPPSDPGGGDPTPADPYQPGDDAPPGDSNTSFFTDDDGDGFSENDGDCDDNDDEVFPGSDYHVDGTDYDCDDLREWKARIWITVDDQYEMCLNGEIVGSDTEWSSLDFYEVVLHEGPNCLGVHGSDVDGVIAGLIAWIEVAGMVISSDGVTDGEPDTTDWRYYPDVEEDPKARWCFADFDDADWGPARFVEEYGNGAWTTSPLDMRGRDPEWIWDSRPAELMDAWFRRVFTLPTFPQPTEPANDPACAAASDPQTLLASESSPSAHLNRGEALTWSGTEFAAAWDQHFAPWRDGVDEIFLQRFDVAGAPLAAPLRLTSAVWFNTNPALSYGDGVYAMVNEDARNDQLRSRLYLERTDGTVAPTETAITSSDYSLFPSVAFDGTYFGIAWQEAVTPGIFDIYFARRLPSGGAVGSIGRVTTAAGASRWPKMVSTGTEWGLTWEDWRDGNSEIYFARLNGVGQRINDDVRVTLGGGESAHPAIAWSGSAFGIVWEEQFDLNREIYFARISPAGVVSTPARLTADGAISSSPSITWDGTGWAVVWSDERTGVAQILMLRISPTGTIVAGPSQITTAAGRSWHPQIVWSGEHYGLLWEEETAPTEHPGWFQARFMLVDCAD